MEKLSKPGFWMSVLLTFMAVMVQTVLSVPLSIIDQVLVSMNRPSPHLANQPVVVGVVNILSFGAAIMVGLLLNRVPLRRAFPLGRPSLLQCGAMALTVLGADILLSEFDNLFRSVATPPQWLLETYRTLMSGENGLVGRIFLLVIVAPVTEELLFRGVILRGLLSRFPSWVAVGMAAFLFAVGHVNPWQFGSAFWIGIAFGWFYLRTGSLLSCIFGHAFSNAMFVLFTSGLFEIRGLTMGPDLHEVAFQPWWLDLTGAVLLLAGIVAFIKTAPQPWTPPPVEPPLIPPQIPFQPPVQLEPPVNAAPPVPPATTS